VNKVRFDGDTCFLIVNSKTYGVIETAVDKEDYNRVKGYTWGANFKNGRPYFQTMMRLHNGKQDSIFLHRLITSFEFEMVDHKDNNTLNNKKENLRAANHSQNMMNSKKIKHAHKEARKFKGVRPSSKNTFRAAIWLNASFLHLGSFKTEDLAAKAYNVAALKYFGEFAKLNEVL
jgi:hypothetical protein